MHHLFRGIVSKAESIRSEKRPGILDLYGCAFFLCVYIPHLGFGQFYDHGTQNHHQQSHDHSYVY
jgi:hypothetical protein